MDTNERSDSHRRAEQALPADRGRGLRLTVPAGSIYALIGPIGAGKTTTIKLYEHEQKLVYTMPMLWIGTLMRGESIGIYLPRALDLHITPVMTLQPHSRRPAWGIGLGYAGSNRARNSRLRPT
jgi:hypothetical protein